MYRVLILENDPGAVRTLETICQVDLLQVDSVEQADSARELLRCPAKSAGPGAGFHTGQVGRGCAAGAGCPGAESASGAERSAGE